MEEGERFELSPSSHGNGGAGPAFQSSMTRASEPRRRVVMRGIKLHFACAIAIIALLVGIPRLEACTCSGPGSPRVARDQAEAVFLGVATSSRDLDVVDGGFPLARAFRFRVSRAWKGVSTETVEVGTSSFGTACGYHFEVGEEYLVYAGGGGIASGSTPSLGEQPVRRSANPPRLWTHACSGTQRFAVAEDNDLLALGTPEWVNPRLKDSLLSDELLRASGEGNTERVKELIAAGHDVNGRDRRYGMTALKAAAAQGHAETVRALLAAGADVGITKAGSTALDEAVEWGHVEVVQLLLAAGGRAGSMALATAVAGGHGTVVEALLARGVPARGEPGARALLAAAERGDVAIARRLLVAGADPGTVAARGSALDVAAGKGDTEMVRLLLRKGARPTQKTPDAGIQSGNREVVRLIDDAYRRVARSARPGPSALIGAARESNLAGIALALERGVEVNAKDTFGDTALMEAVSMHQVNAVHHLLKAGADPNLAGAAGVTPLMRAARNGSLELLEVLLKAGANIEAQQQWEGKEDGTALLFAVEGDRSEAVRFLLKAGASVNAPFSGIFCGTILGAAVRRGDAEIVRLLIDAGADVNARRMIDGSLEDPPLTAAAEAGDTELVQLLLDRGAQIDARDASGQTALERARWLHHAQVIELLRKASARQ